MRPIRLAVVVALLAGGTALGQSVISYELELGGNNQVEVWEQAGPPWGNPPFIAGDPADMQTCNSDNLLTWDVVVRVSGMHQDPPSGPGHNNETNGASNMVFTLQLFNAVQEGPDWVCGDVPVATAKYDSTMNDGDADGNRLVADPLEMAACCHIYDINSNGPISGEGPGRVYDVPDDGGPRLDRAQFPSTLNGDATHGANPPGYHGGGRMVDPPGTPAWQHVPGDTDDLDDTKIGIGELAGMGAGYTQFKPIGAGGLQTAGVGIWPYAIWYCYRGLGHVPVFEGQIDVTGMALGTYCLKLVPGDGNNILRGDFECTSVEMYDFAVPANEVVDDYIIFEVVPGTGCDATLNSWASVRYHAGPVSGELGITLDASASGIAVVSETRRSDVDLKVVIDITATGTLTVTGTIEAEDVSTDATYAAAPTVIDNGSGSYTLELLWAGGLPDEACYKIDLTGKLSCTIQGDADCMLRGLAGDTNGDTNADLIDMAQVKSKNGDPVVGADVRFDVNLDGNIDLIDMAMVKSLNGGSATCP